MTSWLKMVAAMLCLVTASVATAQVLPEPVLDSDIQLRADRATQVRTGQSTLLLLEGDVQVSVGGFGFRDQKTLVRLTRRPGLGTVVWDLAVVFEKPESTGTGGIHADASGLLVTASSRGKVELTAEHASAPSLPDDPMVAGAIRRLADYDKKLAQPNLPVAKDAPLTPEQIKLREKRQAQIAEERRTIELPEPGSERVDTELVERPVLPVRGTVRYGPVKRPIFDRKNNAVILIGGVTVMYQDADEGRDVVLSADRIVIFLDKTKGEPTNPLGGLDATDVVGVYLEDDIKILDGDTTVRAPRAYYDMKLDRAILLDAVVYSQDVRRDVPLYMRAQVIRQTSADSFQADDAVLTTSAFAKPHLSIGASRLSLQRIERADGENENWVTAEDLTLNVGQTPVFFWPKATVESGSIPLRRLRVGFESENGAETQSTWDIFALTGMRAPGGVELLGNIDLRGEHGLALGAELNYDRNESVGDLRGYFLPSDSGTDEIADRADVAFDEQTRGFFRARHRQFLPAGWEIWLEANHVSDPTLLEEFFTNEAYAARPYETSAYFKKAQDDWSMNVLVKGEVNNFTPQYAPLLTPGYTVNKLPEAEYRLMTGLLDDTLTLYHESRVGRMRAVFGNDSPADRGFNAAQSAAAFGIAPGTSFDDAAIAANFPRSIVTRLDSRSEIAAPLRAGAFDLTPFATGRLTAYDTDFSAYNGGEDDQARLWGGLGVKASTQLSKTYGEMNSKVLDVQGIRHIIEPGISLAVYDGTMNSGDLPIYDPQVERLTEGGVARLGVVNTWQTRRGSTGRERTIDWLSVRTDVILATEDPANTASLGRYTDYRPEYTLGDEHFYGELLWAVTEATAVTGELTHNFDQASVVQWRAGIENRHDRSLSSSVHYREIDALDARLLSYGATMQLTEKYRVGLYQVIDFGQGNSRTVNFAIDRKMPNATIGLAIGYDDLDGEASLSVVLTPQGSSRGLNSDFLSGR